MQTAGWRIANEGDGKGKETRPVDGDERMGMLKSRSMSKSQAESNIDNNNRLGLLSPTKSDDQWCMANDDKRSSSYT